MHGLNQAGIQRFCVIDIDQYQLAGFKICLFEIKSTTTQLDEAPKYHQLEKQIMSGRHRHKNHLFEKCLAIRSNLKHQWSTFACFSTEQDFSSLRHESVLDLARRYASDPEAS